MRRAQRQVFPPVMMSPRRVVLRAAAGALACAVLVGASGCQQRAQREDPTPAPRPAPTVARELPAPASTTPISGATIADVAEKVTPSVVNVFSERLVGRDLRTQASPFGLFDLDRPAQREQGLGSGVIVSSDGVIVTNHHVIAQADRIRIGLKDGRSLDATLVGSDPQSDIAVLRVQAQGLPALPTVGDGGVRIGDVVVAIGNPFGIGQTVTMGIISAVGRANMGLTDYEDFIQTDAAINPGNSGGALVNMRGELVGINTAIVSRTGGNQGIGFAIPSRMAMQITDSILEHGKVQRGWLGVAIQDVTTEIAEAMDLTASKGVILSDVSSGGPASEAGLRRGDVIIAVNGTPTDNAAQLRNLVAFAGPGKEVTLRVLRAGKEQDVAVTLGELPDDAASAPGAIDGPNALAGVTVQEIDRQARRALGIPADLEGVLVASIDRQSPAARSGLRPGDVIVELNRVATPDIETFRAVASQVQGRLLLLVYRQGVALFLTL